MVHNSCPGQRGYINVLTEALEPGVYINCDPSGCTAWLGRIGTIHPSSNKIFDSQDRQIADVELSGPCKAGQQVSRSASMSRTPLLSLRSRGPRMASVVAEMPKKQLFDLERIARKRNNNSNNKKPL